MLTRLKRIVSNALIQIHLPIFTLLCVGWLLNVPTTDRVYFRERSAQTTDTPTLPVNHCSQSSAFRALNRKACGTCKDGKTASQAKVASQATVHHIQCWYIATDGRKQSEGLVIVVPSTVQMNQCSKKYINKLPFCPVSKA